MGRILLLTPLIFTLIYFSHNKQSIDKIKPTVPLFIIVFIILSLINSFDLINLNFKHIISYSSHFLLIVAMSAIGLKIHFNSIKGEGIVALKIGTLIFIIQIFYSLSFLIILK